MKLDFGLEFWALSEAALRRARRDLQTRMDMVASGTQGPRKVNWGPWEFVQTLGEATDHMARLQETKDFVVRATLGNQLLVFRPNHQGDLACVDDDQDLQGAKAFRLPPSRGLKPALCNARVEEARARGLDAFPKPNWESLDDLGDLRQVAPPHQDVSPEDCLDLPEDQLNLSEKARFMLRPIQERVQDLEYSEDTVRQVQAQARRQARRPHKGRWSSLLAGRMFAKHSTAWKKKLEDAGRDIQKFTRMYAPVVHGAKAVSRLAKMKKSRGFMKKARVMPKKTDPPQVIDEELNDHPHVGQEVRVVDQAHQMRGLVGLITKVYRRTSFPGVPGVLWGCLAMKNNLQHFTLDQVMLIRDEKDQGLLDPAPAKMNYQGFRAAAKERHMSMLNIQENPSRLEFARNGDLQEMATVHCGILEIMTRLEPYLEDNIQWISPSSCVSLAHIMGPGEEAQGSNREELDKLRVALDVATVFFAITWAPNHYVLVTAHRSTTKEAWRIGYQDSLPEEHQACRDATEALLRNLVMLTPVENLPHSQVGPQRDAWSCGLWALKNLEDFLRARRKEIVQADMTIHLVLTRLNNHITKLRPGVAPPKPSAPARGKTTRVHATLEEALEAAQACRKCRPTKMAIKGCQECMGDWFQEIRQRKR